ncbi:sensor domain-containing diguanylate cyclase [Parasalinivibrio latis]|uniref:sensor domain-containing diguanylate cyclase n=1 Tax=Parasalinivibrio latis TaxID=2952610 RepID=UPI0030E2B568
MHKLLKRQLYKIFGEAEINDSRVEAFLDLVTGAYKTFERNEQLLRRAMTISTEELKERNVSLDKLLSAFPDTTGIFNDSNFLLEFRCGAGFERFKDGDFLRHQPDTLPFVADENVFASKLSDARKTQEVTTLEYLLVNEGESQYVEARMTPLDGLKVLVIFRDVTERRMVEKLRKEALIKSRRRQQQLRYMVHVAPVGIVICNSAGAITMINSYAQEKFHLDKNKIMGEYMHTLFAESSRKDYIAVRNLALSHEVGEIQEKRFDGHLISSDGTGFIVDVGVASIDIDDDRILAHVIGDITERKNLEEELWRLASVDPLTGALNRREFTGRMEKLLEEAKNRDEPVSLLMMDLDHFKRINDNFGHSAGDDALCAFVSTVSGQLRGKDIMGRFGGEEFVVALPGTDPANAKKTAERIRKMIRGSAIETTNGEVWCTVSIGISCFPSHGVDMEDLLRVADDALYQCKRRGRDQVLLCPMSLHGKEQAM